MERVMRKKIIISWFFLAVTLFGCTSGVEDARGQSLTTDTKSTSFQDTAQKISFLKKYVVCPSAVIDTEFHIYYHDSGTGAVPGPSDWNIAVAVKINPKDLPLWTEEMHEIQGEEVDPKWWDELPIQDWEMTEEPVFYQRAEQWIYVAAYPESGVVLKFAATMK